MGSLGQASTSFLQRQVFLTLGIRVCPLLPKPLAHGAGHERGL